MVVLFILRGIVKAFKSNPKIAQAIYELINSNEELPRQLKDLVNDAKLIEELVIRYRTYNIEPVANNQETMEAIASWLRKRNPYQSELLKSACITADGLSRLNSPQFSGPYKQWSLQPRKLIVHPTSNAPTTPVTSAFISKNPSVIIL